MPAKKYSKEMKNSYGNNDCCAVCLEEFQLDKDIIRQTLCWHVFHHDCVEQWLKK